MFIKGNNASCHRTGSQILSYFPERFYFLFYSRFMRMYYWLKNKQTHLDFIENKETLK